MVSVRGRPLLAAEEMRTAPLAQASQAFAGSPRRKIGSASAWRRTRITRSRSWRAVGVSVPNQPLPATAARGSAAMQGALDIAGSLRRDAGDLHHLLGQRDLRL